ncbi:MAG: EAL domain-containing protein [Acidimicrobiales bacterium]
MTGGAGSAGAPVRPGAPAAETDEWWRRRLERALGGYGVRAVYQPIVDLQRRTVVGYEALARFQVPEGDSPSPDRWFAAAHRLGLGAELDAVALHAAFSARADLPPNCFLTVNVDPESLLAAPVRRALAQQGHLGGVVIEITEHRPWDWTALEGVVNNLRTGGALFAVDDAGSGYAGLQQILQLRPAILKLDRALVAGIDGDEAKTALVEMLGLFANRVDAWVLAEGVETEGEAFSLVDLGVPLAQGWLFGRPAPPWAGLSWDTVERLADFARRPTDTLHRLVEPVPAAGPDVDLAMAWNAGTGPWMAVLDQHGRPAGLVDGRAALRGELVPAAVANVHASPAEVAHRLATAPGEPIGPVIVTDNAGRYLGLVSQRRLLGRLARAGPGRVGPPDN